MKLKEYEDNINCEEYEEFIVSENKRRVLKIMTPVVFVPVLQLYAAEGFYHIKENGSLEADFSLTMLFDSNPLEHKHNYHIDAPYANWEQDGILITLANFVRCPISEVENMDIELIGTTTNLIA